MGYLVFVYDTRASEIRLKHVPLIRDFPDVLSDKILDLPIEREMKFAIDLILGTHPISLPLYRMALVELKKLKM